MCISELRIDALVRAELATLTLSEEDVRDFRDVIREYVAKDATEVEIERARIKRDLGLVRQRLDRLTDALVDGLIDKPTYDERKAALVAQKLDLLDRRSGPVSTKWETVAERFELAFAALQGYRFGNDDQKREIVQIVSSNLLAAGKQPVFPMFSPFSELREWSRTHDGAPHRGAVRTFLQKLEAAEPGRQPGDQSGDSHADA